MAEDKQVNKMSLLGTTSSSNRIKLYHGSPNKIVHPTYGMGKDTHDYGRGFYLTSDIELAKEWARNKGVDVPGWLHSYELDCTGLSILDFEKIEKNRGLFWITELLQHRVPDSDALLEMHDLPTYKAFLDKNFNLNAQMYDVVCGWRADDSYFKVATTFLGNVLDMTLLEKALRLGSLGIQYCCKSRDAFAALREVAVPESVPDEYALRYTKRDLAGRMAFDELIAKDNKSLITRFTFHDMVRLYLKNGGKL